MSYAKLLGLEREITDCEVMKLLSRKGDLTINKTTIRIPVIIHVNGDFGEPTN